MACKRSEILILLATLSCYKASAQTTELVSFTYSEGPQCGQLDMTFSGGVQPTSCNAQSLTFQNSASTPTLSYQLQHPASLCTQLGGMNNAIRVRTSSFDYSEILNTPGLWDNINTAYLSFTADFLNDISAMPVVEVAANNAQQPGSFSGYTVSPVVSQFDVDLDAGILTLQFDQLVSTQTLDYSKITIQDDSTGPTVNKSFSNGVVLTNILFAMEFRFLMANEDINGLKSNQLCRSSTTCFGVFAEGIVSNPSGTVSDRTISMETFNILGDVSPVYLTSFLFFDLDEGTFALSFSEPVDETNAVTNNIQLSNVPNVNGTVFGFKEGILTSSDSTEVEFDIHPNDLDDIKLMDNLCTVKENCWIALSSFFITDTSNNPFLHSHEATAQSASFHQPDEFIRDSTPPQLEQFIVDLDTRLITLVFSEPVLYSLLKIDGITLQSAPTGTVSKQLTTSIILNTTSNYINTNIFLTENEFDFLVVNNLYSNLNDSYITIEANATQDTSGNWFAGILNGSAFQATNYTKDVTRPVITNFTYFDLENGALVLQFSEPVLESSIMISGFSIVNGANDSMGVEWQNWRLTENSQFQLLDDYRKQLRVSLSGADRIGIKVATRLAVDINSTYMTAESTTARDYATNFLTEVHISAPIPVLTFIPDTSPARLDAFGLDLNTDILTLSFDDVVNASALDASNIQLRSSNMAQATSYWLTDSAASCVDSNIITVELSLTDVNAIKSSLDLAATEHSTYLRTVTGFILDIEGREVEGNTESLAVLNFAGDTTSPTLEEFSLDMNVALLYLTFSEPILVSSFSARGIVIQNSMTTSIQSVTLVESMVIGTESPATPLILVELSIDELNEIKVHDGLGTSSSDTFLSVGISAANDTASNPLNPINTSFALAVSDYTGDSISPQLTHFILNLKDGALQLYFDEPVLNPMDAASLGSAITLQNRRDNPLVAITLEDSLSITQMNINPNTGEYANELQLELSDQTTAQISNNDGIANSVEDLFISISASSGIQDYSMNTLVSKNGLKAAGLVRSCPVGTYNSVEQGTCDQCQLVCSDGCTGPLEVASEGGCEKCSAIVMDENNNQVMCLPVGDECPHGTYSTDNTSVLSDPNVLVADAFLCLPCHPLCSICSGPEPTACSSCQAAQGMSSEGTFQCLQNCDEPPEFIMLCNECHSQCIGCSGPTQRDCVSCRGANLTVEGDLVCIPECSTGMYLMENDLEEYVCQQCHEECVDCIGGTDFDCSTCQNFKLNAASGFQCVPNCPDGTYIYNDTSECLSCDEQCSKCFGPEPTECTECVNVLVSIEGGLNKCVEACDTAMMYDTEEEKCVLSESVLAVIISTSVLVPLALVVAAAVFVGCLLKKQKLKGKVHNVEKEKS